MKKYLFLFAFALSILSSCTPEESSTTYYLIRHAEKDRTDKTNRNPDLNEKGTERAKKWAEYFKDIDLNLVFSTNYKRTMQTAKPTAESKGLETYTYNPRVMNSDAFKIATKGKKVLVVGHSNTTNAFTNLIIGEKKYEQIDDNNNSNLYIVTVTKKDTTSVLLKIN
jgi:broad specificity phosphatase PhoE